MCHELPLDPNLPLLYRASLSLTLATKNVDDEAIYYAEQALHHFGKVCEQCPCDLVAAEFVLVAQNVLNKIRELKKENEEEDRQQLEST
jgi:pyrroline-5-carboxylate reductase